MRSGLECFAIAACFLGLFQTERVKWSFEKSFIRIGSEKDIIGICMSVPSTIDTLSALESERSAGKKIVFTNGCFDILHVGHLRYLQDAKDLADVLIVGLNSDASVRRLKGDDRPIVCEEERAEMLLGLKSVDFVCLFEEDTPLELIKKVNPDFLVKGGDWPVEQIVGHDYIATYGGKTLSLPFVDGKSTTRIVEKISAQSS